jgi:isoleucyl-tRNA synthetase
MTAPDTARNYKDTVLLPKTDFPMKADLVTREPQRLAKWQEGKLYQRIVAQSKGKPTFILHDGPPFANGDVHMGTALNKVLKDLIVKSKTMAGFHTPFIPGWDCHGLPIEFKVVKSAAGLTPVEVRTRSEAEARKYIDIQRTSFKRLGVFGDWENPYLTLDPGYESGILRTFGKAVEKGLVYRMKRPVLWSYGAQTALAEAEVEYKEKTSPAVFVKFALVTPPPGAEGASLVIWTTTPWTLPANLAIALHPEFEYVCGKFTHADGRSEKLVIAKSRLEGFAASTGFVLDTSHANDTFKGSALNGGAAQHPFLPRTSKVINTLFVTDDTGTGAVHIAPGHGADDYQAGREHGLDILSPVDADGKYTAECGLPDFVGKHVFSSNDGIIEILTAKGAILGNENTSTSIRTAGARRRRSSSAPSSSSSSRSTPSARRPSARSTKSPGCPHPRAIASTAPSVAGPTGASAASAPGACLVPFFMMPKARSSCAPTSSAKSPTSSRSRAPISGSKKTTPGGPKLSACLPIRNAATTRSTCGSTPVAATSACLDRHPELHCPADLYIEATDQHRGWFQSSLMMSIVARDAAPYKSVITHGFVVDTSGKKISKSDQGTGKSSKPMTADHYYNKYGGDMVRLWVSSVDYQNEVPFSEELFQQTGESYRRIRNTFRVLLGNLHDEPKSTDSSDSTDSDSKNPSESAKSADYTLIDRWILERLHAITAECVAAYAAYDFRKVFTVVNSFFATELSALYIDITKDRMYCDAANSPAAAPPRPPSARSPRPCANSSPPSSPSPPMKPGNTSATATACTAGFPQPNPAFAGTEATAAVEELLKVRVVIQQAIEKARQEKKIGSNLEATVALTLPAEGFTHAVFSDPATLHEFLILSDLQITRGGDLAAVVTESSHHKCARCWKHLPDVGTHAEHPTLCGRCAEAVG